MTGNHKLVHVAVQNKFRPTTHLLIIVYMLCYCKAISQLIYILPLHENWLPSQAYTYHVKYLSHLIPDNYRNTLAHEQPLSQESMQSIMPKTKWQQKDRNTRMVLLKRKPLIVAKNGCFVLVSLISVVKYCITQETGVKCHYLCITAG